MIRSLHVKIFIWFWGALLAVTAAVAFFTVASSIAARNREGGGLEMEIQLPGCPNCQALAVVRPEKHREPRAITSNDTQRSA